MTIDFNNVVPGSAKYSNAIGGGKAVKVRLANRKGEPLSDGLVSQFFLFGAYPEDVARELVRECNNYGKGATLTSASLVFAAEASAQHRPAAVA